MFTQCLLKRENAQHVAWIPSKVARAGRQLTIHGQPGWRVAEVYSTDSEDAVKSYERFYDHWAKIRGLR